MCEGILSGWVVSLMTVCNDEETLICGQGIECVLTTAPLARHVILEVTDPKRTPPIPDYARLNCEADAFCGAVFGVKDSLRDVL